MALSLELLTRVVTLLDSIEVSASYASSSVILLASLQISDERVKLTCLALVLRRRWTLQQADALFSVLVPMLNDSSKTIRYVFFAGLVVHYNIL